MRRGYVFGRMFCIAHRPLQSLCNELSGLFRSTIRSGTVLCQDAIESVLQGKLMVNLPPVSTPRCLTVICHFHAR